ncbi:MAG: tetratricopeptide repeat protein [Hormoscilla sp. SP5CHS1]|nr:tetratricopeptide repeat protein [Hormoscilla sp. SP5CHS1]
MGLALQKFNHEEQAVACYEKAISIDHNCAEIYSNLASILGVYDLIKEEIAYCKKAITIKPEKA